MVVSNEQTVSRRVAVVTGGNRGIGAAIAKRLAEGGADVVLTYRNDADKANAVAEVIRAGGSGAEARQLDAGDIEAGRQLIDAVAGQYGKVDILVNNGGVFEAGDITVATPEQFDNTMNVNVRGVYFLTKAALQHMPEGGRIVNIGSIWGESVPFTGIDLYCISKFAVAGMTRALARDLGPSGITVNCVQPGPVDTAMNPSDGDLAQAMTPRSPVGRYGKVEEIAEMVAYLVGPHTQNTTGAILNVDGGWNA